MNQVKGEEPVAGQQGHMPEVEREVVTGGFLQKATVKLAPEGGVNVSQAKNSRKGILGRCEKTERAWTGRG